MGSFLIDTYGMPSDAELKMAGCVGACRYVSHQSGKNVEAWQIAHIHSLGKMVVLNFEDSATNARGGARQGSLDAAFVLGELATVKAPHGIAVPFSVDYEVHTGQAAMSVVLDYFHPIATRMRGEGFLSAAYADYDVLVALFQAGLIDVGWQTVAWSYGKRDPKAALLQDTFTQAYDKDEILAPFYGAWTPTGAQTKTPAAAVDPLEEVMTMYATKAEFEAAMTACAKAGAVEALVEFTRDPAKHQLGIFALAEEADLAAIKAAAQPPAQPAPAAPTK